MTFIFFYFNSIKSEIINLIYFQNSKNSVKFSKVFRKYFNNFLELISIFKIFFKHLIKIEIIRFKCLKKSQNKCPNFGELVKTFPNF